MSLRILIADDQHLVRAGFRTILSTQPGLDVVGEAADGTEAVAMAGDLEPDVVLMDIRMPGLDGIEATRRIVSRGQPPEIRVLILTTFDLDEYVYDALQAGASGFLLKDSSPEQLTAAVRMVRQGDALLAPSITRRLIEEFATSRTPAHPPAGLDQLSSREREVFTLVAHGLSNREIAGQLFVGETTVKTHVTRILTKLGLRDRVQAVVLAYETGVVAPGRAKDSAERARTTGTTPDGATSRSFT
jgi:DNA-binding NarL/FixJ family response regulator